MTKALLILICSILPISYCLGQNTLADSVQLGELIFKGQANHLDSAMNCSSCHFLIEPDTFSWNPTAFEIARSFTGKTNDEWEEMLEYPMSEVMFIAHEGSGLSTNDYEYLKIYFQHLQELGPQKKKVFPYKTVLFLIVFVLLVLVLFDRIFLRKINHSLAYNSVLAILTLCLIFMGKDFVYGLGLQQEYEPDQPIKFSHKTHCQQNQTSCVYCHSTVKKGAQAGLPAINICMNCHTMVSQGSKSGEFEIKKVLDANIERQPIHWVRLNNLPAHVKFDHSLHYVAGGIDCMECHGEVEQMDRMRNETPMTMHWCLDCHEKEKISVKQKNFQYTHHSKTDSLQVKELGGWDCMSCHH